MQTVIIRDLRRSEFRGVSEGLGLVHFFCHPLLGSGSGWLSGWGLWQTLDAKNVLRAFVWRKGLEACLLDGVDVAGFDKQYDDFAKLFVPGFGDHKANGQVWSKPTFYFLGLEFQSAAADGVVASSEDAEAPPIGVHFDDVVGDQYFGADVGGLDAKATFVRPTDADASEWFVPEACLRPADASEGDVRECLGHAVGAPNGVGKVAQGRFKVLVDGASAYDQVAYLHESTALFGLAERVVHLHGHHGGKVDGRRNVAKRMPTGFHRRQPQAADYRSHDHHLARDVVEWQAEQGCVARLQT